MTGARPAGPLAAVPAGPKFALLFLASIALYAVPGLAAQIGFFVLAAAAVLLTRTPLLRLARMLAGLFLVVGVVAVTLVLTTGWEAAAVSALRLLSLCFLAYAVTLSTAFSEMLALFEALLRPARRLGLNPAQISLALSMTIRFIPEIRTQYLAIREAQFARGLHHRPVAVLVPLLVRTLESAQEISAAIDARCYDSAPSQRRPAPPLSD
ncbi:energy-coupling factor transporter transmembrane component T family protein [Kocuria oceani]|uniref:energy-coupling factor transporter transmembrane component T family protein n=1 Tax=Kocuria oceani TaxID=988827 RepID=UPI004036DD54